MKRDAVVPDRIHPPENSPLSKLAHFGFLTLPNFSMIAFTSAIEVLRMANYVGRAEHYTWSVITPDGEPAREQRHYREADENAGRSGHARRADCVRRLARERLRG